MEVGGSTQDWASAANLLHFGEKKAQVMSILRPTSTRSSLGYYAFMSLLTEGFCVYLKDDDPREVGLMTINILLEWMGADEDLLVVIGADMGKRSTELSARLVRFQCTHGIEKFTTEYDGEVRLIFIDNRSHQKTNANVRLLGPTLTPGLSSNRCRREILQSKNSQSSGIVTKAIRI
ncbi:hypothetical protein N7478_002115 [Penicillium angulare]|uniref:uncharacterized protein n=1 Tax=Penicillium angulare TaxID=116970 RepID=UPI00254210C1|nr:uncharacterized protein N7478_002115 [Penicillium angulare]KAJ5289085.1 hypothetical protein N7478_002115 [Penicillium angulare]